MTTIAEIRARRAAITPGEWYRYMRGIMVKDYSTDTGVAHVAVANQIGTDNIMDAPQGISNATFIAAAPADIDHLLATIDKLAEALMEARLKQADNPYQAGTVEWLAHLSGTGHTISAQIEEEFGL